jgi:copper homeostasis protein
MPFQLEICCFNLQSALIAQAAGASRIELCADPAEGGTTPSYGTIKMAREKLSIPLYPIIRPRTGDFLYADEDYEIMLRDLQQCRILGCDGVVVGMLLSDGSVDKKKAGRLVKTAYPMGVTFHRAFDWTANPFEAMADIIDIGCERILTSGQRPTAAEGALLINELIREAGQRISIMPGSGIRSANILELAKKTGAEEFHSSARVLLSSQMEFIQEGMAADFSRALADGHEIKSMLLELKNHFTNQPG